MSETQYSYSTNPDSSWLYYTSTPSLITTSTPASFCFTTSFTPSPYGSDNIYTIDGTVTFVRGCPSGCYPPNFYAGTPYSDAGPNTEADRAYLASFYSPGICPSGFKIQLQSIEHATITKGLCCPPSYSYIENESLCSRYGVYTVVINKGSDTTSMSSMSIPYWDMATPVQIAWEARDLSLLPTATVASSTGISSSTLSRITITLGPTATPTQSYQTASPTSTAGLSTGAQAGIGVASAVVGLALLAAVGFWIFRRRRKVVTNSSDMVMKSELPGDGVKLSQLGDDEIYEAGSWSKPSEMDDMNVRAELEGDWRGYEAPVDRRSVVVDKYV